MSLSSACLQSEERLLEMTDALPYIISPVWMILCSCFLGINVTIAFLQAGFQGVLTCQKGVDVIAVWW